MTEIRIHFEGDPRLRQGFRAFLAELFSRAGARRCRIRLIATRGTPERDFRKALTSHPNAWNILLRDREGPLPESASREPHADSMFWMVELMEAWFLADPNTLAAYYGHGFQSGALRSNRTSSKYPREMSWRA